MPTDKRDWRFVGGEAQVFEISITVKSLEESMEKFRSVFGWEPYMVRDDELRNFKLRGETVELAHMKYACYYAGSVRIELVEAVDGDSVYSEFLKKRGPGVQHIGIRVSDRDKELAQLQEKGIGVLQSLEVPFIPMKMAYLDTMDEIGVSLELVECPSIPATPEFDELVKARIAGMKRK